jgi:hypothetical protein
MSRRAHMVGRSCDECGAAVAVPESAAARGPILCDDCEHTCQGNLQEMASDPALPPQIDVYQCRVCGEWWHHNRETGEVERDV